MVVTCCMCVLGHVGLFATLWTVACQAPLSVGFPSNTGVGCHFPLQSNLFSSVQSLSHVYVWLCDPMNHSTPGLPVHHHLLEFTQTHVHRVSDAIQPSHSLSSPSPPAPKSLPASESFPMSQLDLFKKIRDTKEDFMQRWTR